MEEYYNRELKRLETLKQGAVNPNPTSKTIMGIGHGQSLKLHLKKATPGEGWTHAEPKDLGPDVSKKYELPRKEDPLPEEPR